MSTETRNLLTALIDLPLFVYAGRRYWKLLYAVMFTNSQTGVEVSSEDPYINIATADCPPVCYTFTLARSRKCRAAGERLLVRGYLCGYTAAI